MAICSENPQRPEKMSLSEILSELGYKEIKEYLEDPSPEPYGFNIRAFPEFYSNGTRPMSIQSHGEHYRVAFTRYLAAYEFTYKYHYEMQDDWLAIITDPEFEQFTGITAASRHENSPWLEHPIDFETFERVMLCVADDDYWAGNVREPWASLDGSVVSTWICRWRRRLGCPVVKGVDDNPWFHKVVWRDNWRDVREVVVEIAKRDFPPIEETGESFDADASVEGALLGLAERLAGRFGLTEEHGSTKCMFGWTFTTWLVARDIADMPWHEYIEARSGRKWDVSGGDFPL